MLRWIHAIDVVDEEASSSSLRWLKDNNASMVDRSIRPSSDQYLVLMKQGFQYSYEIWIKAWTCQAWMHLNIEQPSIISFLGPALEMKAKGVEGPGPVKRFKSADICIPLKIKCIVFVIGGLHLWYVFLFVTMMTSLLLLYG